MPGAMLGARSMVVRKTATSPPPGSLRELAVCLSERLMVISCKGVLDKSS